MNVKVFSTTTCPWCTKVKEFLKESKIEFKDINVGEDQDAAKEMADKSGQMGVPVTVVENNGKEDVIVGFDKPKLEKALGLAA